MPAPLLTDKQFAELRPNISQAKFTLLDITETTDIYGAKCALISYKVNAAELEYDCAIEATVFVLFSKKIQEVCVVPEFPSILIQNYTDKAKTERFFVRTLSYAIRSLKAVDLLETLFTCPEETQMKRYNESDVLGDSLDFVGEKARTIFKSIQKAFSQETEEFVLEEPKHLAEIEVDFNQALTEKDIVEAHVKLDRLLIKDVTPMLKYGSPVVSHYQTLLQERADSITKIADAVLIGLQQQHGVFAVLMKKVKRARLLQEAIQNEMDEPKRNPELAKYSELTQLVGNDYLVAREFAAEVQRDVAAFFAAHTQPEERFE